MTSGRHRTLAIVLVGGAIAGCAKSGKTETASLEPQTHVHASAAQPAPTPAAKPKAADGPPATNRPANHKGVVVVGEWHHIAVGKTTMHRSPEAFLKDLERLDRTGFRPVTAQDWLSGKMDLPKGASPVVMTFDDANPDQFRLTDAGEVDPKCGVGIWLEFAKTHPEFPVRATFFVLPTMWGQPKWVSKKLELLKGWGCEVANHTITHVPLRKQTDERVKQEVGDAALALDKLGEKGPYNLAYPLGSTPKNAALLKGFDWKGSRIVTPAGFLVGANPASFSPKDLLHIPRIQATTGDYGLDYWLDKVEKGTVKVYVQ